LRVEQSYINSDRSDKTMNTLRTAILMAALMGLFVAVGAAVGGVPGMVVAFCVAGAMNLFAYWNSDKVLLRMYGAHEVDAASAPDLHALVAQLAQAADLPMPRVFITDNAQPNAFATGRSPDHAAVCVTSGLLAQVSQQELAGVLAHELGHVKHRDTLIMTITAVMAGAVSMLATFAFFFGGRDRNNPLGLVGMLVVMLVAPLAAALVQAAISRSREYEADKMGAQITGRPMWLAGALERIEKSAHKIPNPMADANPASAHMFIINPLHGGFSGLFSSHPATSERVARLRDMAGATHAPAPITQITQAAPAASAGPSARGPWG
jgi:heat shock protein HtpX